MDPATLDALEKQITPWWTRTYPRLAQDLGFDPETDRAAARRLDGLLSAHGIDPLPLDALRLADGVVVAGAADRLPQDLQRSPPSEREAVIVADGAVHEALRHTQTPHLVVTDLDGDPGLLQRLNENGVPLAVHAHGDNIPLLERWIPRFTGPILATRQTPGDEPRRVLCPGGFADGDRAVFLAARLGATAIRLVGFDLYGPPGKASPTRREQKKRKMRWSARLLEEAPGLGVPLESETTGSPA